MLRSSVLLAVALTLAAFIAGPAASDPPTASTAPTASGAPAVVCDKDQCTCVGAPNACFAAFTTEKKCSDQTMCTRPPEGTPDADNKWTCACKTKSSKAKS